MWIFAAFLIITATMLSASIAAKEQCACSAEMQAKIQVMENALNNMKALCAVSGETDKNIPLEEEQYTGGNEPADLERCTAKSLWACYGSAGEEEMEFAANLKNLFLKFWEEAE